MKSYRVWTSDWLEPKALINLQFSVQPSFLDKHSMTWREDSTYMVYIRLKAADKQYGITEDKEGFDALEIKPHLFKVNDRFV